jgi:MarR family transcriptional regulator, organic hydroperoxide resistance regulator
MQVHQLQMHLSIGYIGLFRYMSVHCLGSNRAAGNSMARNSALRLDDYLPYLVNRVGAALVERFTGEALGRHDLTIDMWRVLAALSNNGGQRQVDLATMTSIEKSTVSRLVTRLVRMNLVNRNRSRTSNREVVVQLSAKGQALVGKLIPVALDLERVASKGASAADIAVMKRILRQVFHNLASRDQAANA